MSPSQVASLVALLRTLEPELLDALHAIVEALRNGDDPTPAERHLEVQAAFALLGIKGE